MKTRLILLLIAAAGTIFAGSYGWNTAPEDDPRILEAFGYILGIRDAQGSPSPAKQRDVSAAAMNWVNQQTSDYERRKNMAQFSPSPFVSNSPTPSPSPTPTP